MAAELLTNPDLPAYFYADKKPFGTWDSSTEDDYEDDFVSDSDELPPITIPDFRYYLEDCWGKKNWTKLVYKPAEELKAPIQRNGMLAFQIDPHANDYRLVLKKEGEDATDLTVTLFEPAPSIASTSHPAKDEFYDQFGFYPATSYNQWGLLVHGRLTPEQSFDDPFGRLEFSPDTTSPYTRPDTLDLFLSSRFESTQRQNAERYLPLLSSIISCDFALEKTWEVDHRRSELAVYSYA